MAIKTLIKFIVRNPLLLMYLINKTTKEFYRAGFISTAISEGIYDDNDRDNFLDRPSIILTESKISCFACALILI
jgi:hypothetical protein